MGKEGNCYAVTEAAYYILGGKHGEWEVHRLKIPGEKYNHWFLRLKKDKSVLLDLSRLQFNGNPPAYHKSVHTGFLTNFPSKKAVAMMEKMTWQEG